MGGLLYRDKRVKGSFPIKFDNDSTVDVYFDKYDEYGNMYVPITYAGQKISAIDDLTPDSTNTVTISYPNDITSAQVLEREHSVHVLHIKHITSYDTTLTGVFADQTIGDFTWINKVNNTYNTDSTCLVIKRENIGGSHSGTILIDDFLKIKDDILYYYDKQVTRWKSDLLVITLVKVGDRRLLVINNKIYESGYYRNPSTFTNISVNNHESQKYNYFIYIGSY